MNLPKMSFSIDIFQGLCFNYWSRNRNTYFWTPPRECFRNFYLSKGNFTDKNFNKTKRYSKKQITNFVEWKKLRQEKVFHITLWRKLFQLFHFYKPPCRRLTFVRLKATERVSLQNFIDFEIVLFRGAEHLSYN